MKARSLAVAILSSSLASGAWADRDAVSVSPGSVEGMSRIADRCPTFHWGEVEGASFYELVVHRVAEEAAAEAEVSWPVIQLTLPGSAQGWTPPLEQCLERGGRYAWFVRAVAAKWAGEWSEAALFQVATEPGEAELQEALVAVQAYLESPDWTAAHLARAGGSPRGTGSRAESGPARRSRTRTAGETARGIFVDGALVETKADGPCYPASGDANRDFRIIDCGNGTITDTVGGGVWLQDVGCAGPLNWWDAQRSVREVADGQCGLSDRSQPGDWRIATLLKVLELVSDARDRMGCTGTPPCDVDPGNAPALPNDPGDQCAAAGPSSILGVKPETVVWTRTTVETDPTKAWAVSLCTGAAIAIDKGEPLPHLCTVDNVPAAT